MTSYQDISGSRCSSRSLHCPSMTGRRMMPESQLRKTKTQQTNLEARPKRSHGPKANFGKLNSLVLFDKAPHDKLCKEVPNYKLMSPAVVAERLKIELPQPGTF